MAISFPANPTNGQVYQGYYYDSTLSAWRASPVSAGPVAIADTAPAGAIHGDMWYNSLDGSSYVYVNDGTSSQWVEVHSNSAALPGTVVQVVDAIVSSATESYTTVADGVEYQVVSVNIIPKFSNSKLFIDASAQVRIINAYGVNSRIKRDGSFVIGNTGYSHAFTYKGDAVNHHTDIKAQGSVISGSTALTTFSYSIVPFSNTGEVVNGRYGMHYIRVMEVAQ